MDINRLEREIAGTRFAGRTSIHARLRSTNDTLRQLARAGAAAGTVVLAQEQTGGRGRLGRTWISEPGLGLYLSVLFRPPPGPPSHWTLAAAVAACAACRESGAGETSIKWPNDLHVRGRKLAGVLVETRTEGARIRELVIGLGVNVHHDAEQLGAFDLPNVTSLRGAVGSGILGGRIGLAATFLRRLESLAVSLESGDWDTVAAAWLEFSPSSVGSAVTVQSDGREPWPGVTAGLAEDGALRVRDAVGRVLLVRQVDSVRFEELS